MLLTQRKPWPCVASSVIAIIATHRDTRQLGKGGPPTDGVPRTRPHPAEFDLRESGWKPCLGSDGLSLATALLSDSF